MAGGGGGWEAEGRLHLPLTTGCMIQWILRLTKSLSHLHVFT